MKDSMTTRELRDWFAGLAMQAIIAKTPIRCFGKDMTGMDLPNDSESFAHVVAGTAIGAYGYADAMLKAREATS